LNTPKTLRKLLPLVWLVNNQLSEDEQNCPDFELRTLILLNCQIRGRVSKRQPCIYNGILINLDIEIGDEAIKRIIFNSLKPIATKIKEINV
jgi:hypothetical protein